MIRGHCHSHPLRYDTADVSDGDYEDADAVADVYADDYYGDSNDADYGHLDGVHHGDDGDYVD